MIVKMAMMMLVKLLRNSEDQSKILSLMKMNQSVQTKMMDGMKMKLTGMTGMRTMVRNGMKRM